MKNALRWFALVVTAGLLVLSCDLGQDEDGGGQTPGASYTVAFEAGEGNELDSLSAVAGTTIELPEEKELTPPLNSVLAGWKDDGDNVYEPGEEYAVTEDVTFVAQWSVTEVLKYEVVFEVGDGGGTRPATRSYLKNKVIELPGQGSMIEPPGKVFVGWDLKGTLFEAGQPYTVKNNVTFTAQWSATPVTVTYDKGQAGGSAPVEQILAYGTEIALPGQGDMTAPAGYAFVAWLENGVPYKAGDTFTVTRDTTFVAWWTLISVSSDGGTSADNSGAEFTVVFYLNDGTDGFVEKTARNGAAYDLPAPNPVWAGHEFAGWFTESLGGTEITAETVVDLAGDQHLYAHWYVPGTETQTAEKFIVTLNLNYNSKSAVTIMTVTNGSTYSALPAPKRRGYEFLGWFTEKTGGQRVMADTVVSLADDQTLYAHWKQATHEIDLANPASGPDFTYDPDKLIFTLESSYDDWVWVVTNSEPSAKTTRALAFPEGFVGTARLEQVTIGGGAVTVSGKRHGIELGARAEVYLEILGNNTVTAPGYGAGIYVGEGAALTITGASGGVDGVLTATGREGGAGIGGFRGEATGSVEISGATLRVNAVGSNGAAGIGGGEGAQAGTVTITGGALVSALGEGGAAGIGGGSEGDAALVTIDEGAAVSAVGGNLGGPGIGGPGSGVTKIDFGDSVVVSLRHEGLETVVGMPALGGTGDKITGLNYGGLTGTSVEHALVFTEATYTSAAASTPVAKAYVVERSLGEAVWRGGPIEKAGVTTLYNYAVSGEPALTDPPVDWDVKMERLEDLGWAVERPVVTYRSTDGATVLGREMSRVFSSATSTDGVRLADASKAAADGGMGIDHGSNMPAFKGWTTKPGYKGEYRAAGEAVGAGETLTLHAVWSAATPGDSAWVASGETDERARKAYVITPADPAGTSGGLKAIVEANARGHYILLTDYTGASKVTGIIWTPSGDWVVREGYMYFEYTGGFLGVFDGNGHTVELDINAGAVEETIGLFGLIEKGAVVKNLRLTGTVAVRDDVTPTELSMGSVTGGLYGSVQDVVSEVRLADLRTYAYIPAVGGIAGTATGEASIVRCVYAGEIESVGFAQVVGGISGWFESECAMSDSVVLSPAITWKDAYLRHRIGNFVGTAPVLRGNYALSTLQGSGEKSNDTADGADVLARETATSWWWAGVLGANGNDWTAIWEAGADGRPALEQSTANPVVKVPVLKR